MHALGHGERLRFAFDSTGPGDNGELAPANAGVRPGQTDDGVVFLDVAADQLVRLGDADDFRDSGHFLQAPAFNRALVAGDADSGALRARNGMGAQAERFDLLTNRTYLLFGGVRLHHYQHESNLALTAYVLHAIRAKASGVGGLARAVRINSLGACRGRWRRNKTF